MEWTAATDADGDLKGYIIVLDNNENTVFAAGTDLSANVTSTTFESLADGTWYFHIRAIDTASNLSAIVTVGPFVINTQPSISAVSPTSGAAGTQIKIYGTAFAEDTSVKIGSTDVTNVTKVVSETELTATVPSTLSTGPYDITVTSGGKYDTESNAFTVSSSSSNNAPQISAGSDKSAEINKALSFSDATATDSDGDNMTYTWSVSEAPSGAVAGTDYTLTSTTSLNGVVFTPLTEKANGTFTLNLTVSDTKTSVSDTVVVTVGAVIGDINGDGKLDLADALSVFNALIGKSSGGVKLTSYVNADGKITAADASFVLLQLSKK